MAQSKSKSSLDSLMMSYADLSTPSRASTFKGPALKDVKVSKQVAPSFKPSDKARDWSTLAQNLEDAFGHNGQSSNQGQQQQPVFPSFPPSKEVSFPAQTSACDMDDWGDFQTTSSTSPLSQSVLPEGAGKPALMSGVSHVQKPKTGANTNAMTAIISPSVSGAEATTTLTTDDAKSQIDNFSQLSSPLSILSSNESVPIRAQALEPVEEEAKPPVTVSVSEASRDFTVCTNSKSVFTTEVRDNFANFQSAILPPLPSSEKSISEAAVTKLTNGLGLANVASDPGTSLSLHQTLTPQLGPTNATDKYSNLRNLFEAKESPCESRLHDISSPLSNYTASSAPQSLQPNVPSSQEEDDDFGDFVTPNPNVPWLESSASASMPPIIKASEVNLPASSGTTNLLPSQLLTEISSTPALPQQQDDQSFLTESAKLSPVCHVHSTIPDVCLNSVFMPQSAVTSPAFAPWISDCPPPDDLIDEQIPSGGVCGLAGEIGNDPLGLSLDGEAIEGEEDKNISQIMGSSTLTFQHEVSSKKDPETGSKSLSERPQSADGDLAQCLGTLSVRGERKGSINSLHLSEDMSSANAEATAGDKDKYNSLYELSSTHQSKEGLYEEWMKALSKINQLLYEGWQSLEAIRSDETLLKEVVESPSGTSYLANLRELHRIYWRISHSYDTLVAPRLELASKCSDVERSWSLLISSCKSCLELSSHYKHEEPGQNVAAALCSVCLASLDLEDDDMNNAVLTLDQASGGRGARYHAACANFWANCVEHNIPDLSCWLCKD